MDNRESIKEIQSSARAFAQSLERTSLLLGKEMDAYAELKASPSVIKAFHKLQIAVENTANAALEMDMALEDLLNNKR